MFLFTDIEGSTRLWEERDEQMNLALARHDEILRGRIAAHGGVVFSTAGDGLGAAFAVVTDALASAIEIQRDLLAQRWPDGVRIAVRMGINSGISHERDGDYFGSAVNRAARLMSIAS